MRSKAKPPTMAEHDRMMACKEGPCMACYVGARDGWITRSFVVHGCDYNHCKSGNIRRGHAFGYALCIYHHRKHPMGDCSLPLTQMLYGPSLMDGSRKFHEIYGSDDELISLQNEVLNGGV